MSKIILRLNTITKTWYDEDGALLADGMPQIPYKSSMTVLVKLYTDTPNAGAPGVNPDADWTKDTQYNVPGITARLSADDNFMRRLAGTLNTAVSAGAVSTVVLKVPSGTKTGAIDEQGEIRLFSSSGSFEALQYTARSKVSDGVFSFTIAEGGELDNSYAVGDATDCPESLYMTAVMDALNSDASKGEFSFDITAYSPKLREAADYANSMEVDGIQGLELAMAQVENDTTTILNTYLCRTFSIPLPMADMNSTPDMPDTGTDNIAAITTALLANGFDVQYSADGENWHYAPQVTSDYYYRFRLAAASTAEWSVVLMPRGMDGDAATIEPGTVTHGVNVTPAVTNVGTSSAAVFDFVLKDGEDAYTYVGFASDSNGADFSLTPSDSLKYRAEIHTSSAIETPVASDFSSATWVKYVGDDGLPSYTYIGYASDSNGTDFSTTASDSLKYRAEIHTSSAIETPVASHFAGKWVKYIGDNGGSIYTYIGFASDASGTNFSLTPSNSLKYRAEIHPTSAIENPSYTDFANADWMKYIGDDGQAGAGTGDMLMSVYDTDSDGKVNAADSADAAVKLSSARYIGSAAFDGTANITLAQIGVNNATVTFMQGGTSKGSITLNQSGNTSISLDAGGGAITWGGISGTLSSQTDLSDALDAKQDAITASSKLDYSLLSNTPTIPTVNNYTITFSQGGVSKGSFTLNQGSNGSIELDAGGGGGSVTWGGISGTLSSQTDLSSALNDKMGVPSNVGTSGQVLTKTSAGYSWQTPSGGGGGGADAAAVRHSALIYG